MQGIREAIGWECLIDKNSVHMLCQFHEVYVDEKQWRMDDVAGTLKTLTSQNSKEKGIGKIQTCLRHEL